MMPYKFNAVNNQYIQPAVWRFPDPLPDSWRQITIIRLPRQLGAILLGGNVPGTPIVGLQYPPVASLHDALAAFSENILAFAPDMTAALKAGDEAPPWLYARDAHFKTQRLQQIIVAWLNVCYGDAQAKALQEGWGAFDWEFDQVDLQNASSDVRRLLLPALAARWLTDQDHKLDFTGKGQHQSFPLFLVPLMSARGQAELMTDPVTAGDELYAFTIRLWADTLPGSDDLYLYQRGGVHRWRTHSGVTTDAQSGKPTIFLRKKRNRSVYHVRPASDYFDSDAKQRVYARIWMRRINDRVEWVGFQAKLAEKLNPITAPASQQDAFPSALALLKEPLKYKHRMLIPLENSEARNADVGTGLHPTDHRQIYAGLNTCFTNAQNTLPVIITVPPWKRVITGDLAARFRTASQSAKNRKKVPDSIKHAGLSAVTTLPITIELWIDRSKLAAIQTAFLQEAGLQQVHQSHIGQDTLTVTLHGRPVLVLIWKNPAGVIEPLLLRNVKEKEVATSIYRAKLKPKLPATAITTGALVHLADYRDYKDPLEKARDPKQALRLGFADSGRITQFLTPNHKPDRKGDDHKLGGAVRDLLRHTGFRFNPLYNESFYNGLQHPEKHTKKLPGFLPEQPVRHLPGSLDLLAFYVFQLNARAANEEPTYLPVMLEVQSNSHTTAVYLPHRAGAKRFATFPQGIVGAVQCEKFSCANNADLANAVQHFFRDALNKRDSERPALLLVLEQNLRRFFPSLKTQDNNTAQTALDGILSGQHAMRVARLRLSRDQDAPFCVTVIQKSKFHGLYAHVDFPNVFISLHDVGAQTINSWVTKIERPENIVNPSNVQIWLNNLTPNDDPAAFAGLIHRLRQESSAYQYATVFPQPLHDVREIAAYLSRFRDSLLPNDAAPDDLDDDNDVNAEEYGL